RQSPVHVHHTLAHLRLLPLIDTSPTHIYTLPLHDALPISPHPPPRSGRHDPAIPAAAPPARTGPCSSAAGWAPTVRSSWPESETDRKSTRLNSSHVATSYAVFCLKKKTQSRTQDSPKLVMS